MWTTRGELDLDSISNGSYRGIIQLTISRRDMSQRHFQKWSVHRIFVDIRMSSTGAVRGQGGGHAARYLTSMQAQRLANSVGNMQGEHVLERMSACEGPGDASDQRQKRDDGMKLSWMPGISKPRGVAAGAGRTGNSG